MMELNFSPFPDLNTERLFLRRMTTADAPELFVLRSDPRVMKFIAREPAQHIKDAEEFIERIEKNIIENEAIMWAIAFKDNPAKMIGNICIWQIQKDHYRGDLGYLLHPDHWNKGIMKEAIRKVIEYGFSTLGFHSLKAEVAPDNLPSITVLEKIGFVREGFFREDYFFRGEFLDTAVYSLLNKN